MGPAAGLIEQEQGRCQLLKFLNIHIVTLNSDIYSGASVAKSLQPDGGFSCHWNAKPAHGAACAAPHRNNPIGKKSLRRNEIVTKEQDRIKDILKACLSYLHIRQGSDNPESQGASLTPQRRMHYGRTYPWISPYDAANSSRDPRVESKACRSLQTECKDRCQKESALNNPRLMDGAHQPQWHTTHFGAGRIGGQLPSSGDVVIGRHAGSSSRVLSSTEPYGLFPFRTNPLIYKSKLVSL